MAETGHKSGKLFRSLFLTHLPMLHFSLQKVVFSQVYNLNAKTAKQSIRYKPVFSLPFNPAQYSKKKFSVRHKKTCNAVLNLRGKYKPNARPAMSRKMAICNVRKKKMLTLSEKMLTFRKKYKIHLPQQRVLPIARMENPTQQVRVCLIQYRLA